MKMCVLAIAALCGAPQESELGKKLLEIYANAADWLVSQQDPHGAWHMGPPGKSMPSPAYTGLILHGLANAPQALRAKYRPAVDRATEFLLSKRNADGSFGEGPTGSFMKTYTTAVCMMALASVERTDRVADALRGAQAYLRQNQLKEGIHRGGLGYGDESPVVVGGQVTTKKSIANLSITGFAAEGMIMAERAGLPRDEEFWKLVVEFVRKCQNNTEVNNDPEFVAALKKAGLSVGDDGGLYYAPVADGSIQKAGTRKIADREVIQSYGSMTYDGIKTYLYAGLRKDSPEVKAAIDWVRKNYSIESHPGFAFDATQRHHLRGLYYYYLVMARALDAYGERPFETFDGRKRDWPVELAEQLLKTVRESKMWKNDNPGWYEGDPVLTTSYVLSTLDILFKHIK
ncbi:MAG TPA: prenyltransferase/squalene oxidase repeat-containing protein [Planctomycetota bacterium]|nr:prenyltransferase/squalene oxidase repeat-containing protein [Planctomycetota bacterium]